MSQLDRRTFLRRTGAALLAPSLTGLVACGIESRAGGGSAAGGARRATLGDGGYGPLAASPDASELLVPDGFRVARISVTGSPSRADASFIVPNAVDGMAAFRGSNGAIRLVRNHEIADPPEVARPFGSVHVYDARASGGTTTVELVVEGGRNDRVIEVVREFPTLNGTHTNCAGGPTPWGSWLSCEETTVERDRKHGYVFEVPSLADGAVEPLPLTAMGRFVHEAVAVDPQSGIVYETEDVRYDPLSGLPGSGFYRFLPHRPGDLRGGGRLEMLAIRGRPNYLTAVGQTLGATLPVEWVSIEDPDPAAATDDPSAVFREGRSKGGAIFHRLEGCWHGDGVIYFDATAGGDAGAGQVWQYRPASDSDGGALTLVFESPGSAVLQSPDNICVSPRGGIVLCEDGEGVQCIRGLTRDGAIFDLVSTVAPLPEFAGACFSPDGDILFFNIQGDTTSAGEERGTTYAMWGPWERGAL
jgi:secreted PhoX family phosphatase